tara:strand:- start:4404 stop:4634 length:231 start_codon:yes stop_codon:yes gene_type:complete
MFKIWFLVALISTPNTSAIKYHGAGGYDSIEECKQQKIIYENYLAEFQMRLGSNAVFVQSYCLEFETFKKGKPNDV